MATVNTTSLRSELDALKGRFEALCAAGKMSAESRALFEALLMLFELLLAVFLEKNTPKNARNSGLPSSETGTDESAYKALRKRYRTVLTQARRELPTAPQRISGKRGRIARSDAENLHQALVKHETEVLRFARNPDVPFTNNLAERDIRMAKVKQKVSGCFRTPKYAAAYCRISSYLQSMAYQGYNPLTTIEIALNGNAATMIKN